MKTIWLVSDGGDTCMPRRDLLLQERRREVTALRQFHEAMVRRASKDPNPYTRALAMSNRPTVNVA